MSRNALSESAIQYIKDNSSKMRIKDIAAFLKVTGPCVHQRIHGRKKEDEVPEGCFDVDKFYHQYYFIEDTKL